MSCRWTARLSLWDVEESPSTLFNAASQALAMQETKGPRDVAYGHDADHGVEGQYHLVGVLQEEASLHVLWVES